MTTHEIKFKNLSESYSIIIGPKAMEEVVFADHIFGRRLMVVTNEIVDRLYFENIAQNFKEFIKCFNASNRYNRKETWHEKNNPEGRWRRFSYNDVIKREKNKSINSVGENG